MPGRALCILAIGEGLHRSVEAIIYGGRTEALRKRGDAIAAKPGGAQRIEPSSALSDGQPLSILENSMVAKEGLLEEQLKKLSPPFPTWVAIRAAMRVLPAIGVAGDFPFSMTNTADYVDAIARLPFVAAVECGVQESGVGDPPLNFVAIRVRPAAVTPTLSRLVSAAARAAERRPFNEGYAASAAAKAARYSADRAAKAALDAALAASAYAFKALGVADANDALVKEIVADIERGIKTLPWRLFFDHPLWANWTEVPRAWLSVIDRFRAALESANLAEIGFRHVQHCQKSVDWIEVGRWLSEEQHRAPVSDQRTDGTPSDSLPAEALNDGERQQLQSVDWWSALCYWLVLDDRQHMQLLEQPSRTTILDTLQTINAADSELPGGGLARRVIGLRQHLAERYGSVSISPLWRAWFQTVHGATLLEAGHDLIKSASERGIQA